MKAPAFGKRRKTGIRAAVLALSLCIAAPAWGDYNRMQDAFDNYSPPELLERRAAQETGDHTPEKVRERVPESRMPEAFQKALDRIKAMRADQEKEIVFGPQYGNETLAKTAADDAAVADRLKDAVDLDGIMALAVLRNPDVAAARQAVLAALNAYDQVTGLDETILAYQGVTRGLTPKAGPGTMAGNARNVWPLPGRTALKGNIVAADVAVARLAQAITEKKTAARGAVYFWDLALADASLDITRETMAVLERLGQVATALYQSGKKGFQDIAGINIRLARLRERLNTLNTGRDTVSVRLAQLLDLPPETRIGATVAARIPDPGSIPGPDALYSLALEHRQELKQVRQKIIRLSHMVELGESMANTGFTQGLSSYDANPVTLPEPGNPMATFPVTSMAGMKNGHPSQAFNALAQPWLAQVRQTLESMKLRLDARERATITMVRDAWASLDKNQREAALYAREIIPLTKSALDVATREYESGAIGFADAMAAYTDWLEARLALAKKQAGAGKALAALEQVMGIRLNTSLTERTGS